MLEVPTIATPSQTLTVSLGGQPCRVNLYQKTTGFYVDLYVNDALIIGGVIARDDNRIVRDAYLGFIGDLIISDTQGTDDPVYTGMGSRWRLFYLSPADLALVTAGDPQ